MSIKGTETEKNILKAFAGESQAKNRYTFFAKVAKKEGYEQISAIFAETALYEESHAKILSKFFEGGSVEITATYPTNILGTTAENLLIAIEGEHEEWSVTYLEYAQIAQNEGFAKIAAKFRLLAKAEEVHEKRFRKLLQNLENGSIFKKDKKVKWICRKCGYVHEGENALEVCPLCDHPIGYFEEMAENY